MRRAMVLALIGGLTLGATPALAGSGEGRISGRVMDIRPEGTLVIEEQGPWKGPNTGLIKQSVALGPDTLIRVVRPKGTWDPSDVDPGYAITASDFRELKTGDFVTVSTGGGSRAVAIDVVRPEGADVGQASPSAESGRK